jgi:uncharacterized damage-inducible protein DinB
MTEVARLDRLLERTSEGEAWHGPAVLELLSDTTATTAALRPLRRGHSIWELVLHIQAWHAAVLRLLGGESAELSEEEDWPSPADTGEASWGRTVEALERSYEKLRQTVRGLSDLSLEQRAEGKEFPVYVMLHGVIHHDVYHGGQIALLKELLREDDEADPNRVA